MIRRVALFCALSSCLMLSAQTQLRLPNGATLSLDDARGRLGTLRDASGRTLVTGGTLWSVGFREGDPMDSDAFLANGGKVAVRTGGAGDATLAFTSADLGVAVHVRVSGDRFEIVGEVTRTTRDILELNVPVRLTFDPAIAKRLVFPQRGNTSLGIALSQAFFQKHSEGGKLVGKAVGPQAYIRLFGANLNQLADNPPPVKVKATAEGEKWFNKGRIASIEREEFCVNRASARGQYTISLFDSPNGPLLCGSDLGGKGLLLRMGAKTGGARREHESSVQRSLIVAAIDALSRQHPERFRGRDVVLLAPTGGPQFGSWSAASVLEWQASLQNAAFLARTGANFVVATSPQRGLAAVDASKTAVILNPFGETMPIGTPETWQETMDKVRDYVRAGGYWCEVGGYPFYRFLTPEPYRTISSTYPSAVADFMHLDTTASPLAVYGVQPLPTKPWEGRDNHAVRLNPATLRAGGDEQGGYLGHGWEWLVKAGGGHRYPALRLLVGVSTKDAIARYKQELGLNRTLADKVKPAAKLTKLKEAVLVRAGARTVGDHMAMLPQMPPACLFHFSEYLHGGFDKQYPDHLPVRASYGTNEQFAELYRRGHELGHLMMPYTNTSWWCIDPKGPTFERTGDAPLLRKLDGSLSKERYSKNEGYTVCYWHPEVIAANRRTHRELVDQFPSDVLFQDQVGARGFRWDTNPASPYATSSPEGLHSMTIEDAETVPVATEDGYDRVAQFETILCGMAWGMIPADGRHAAANNRFHFVDGEWEFFPLMGYLAHGNCLFTAHDLGHFISNPERLAYALAFGYGMTEVSSVGLLKREDRKAWLFWLDAVQKTVCAAYGGQPLLDFQYPLAASTGADRDVMLARYQGVTVLSNIGDKPLPVSSIQAPEFAAYAKATVAAPGFLAVGPGVQAGMLHQADGPAFGFALRQVGRKVVGGVLAQPDAPVPAGVPVELLRRVSWRELDKTKAVVAPGSRGGLSTPAAAGREQSAMPDAWVGKAPTAWPGRSLTIVVPVFADAPSSWVDLTGQDWVDALKASKALQQAGCTVQAVADAKAFVDLLRADPAKRPLAVINPGGEYFYGDQPDPSRMLAIVKDYVDRGGIWWETGGYSFHSYAYADATGAWQKKGVGPSGAGGLGFRCGGYDVEDPARPLKATKTGAAWLGAARAKAISQLVSGVQRPFSDRPDALNLVLGGQDGFAAAIRGDGWGWLWRLGGFRPDPKAAKLAVVGTLEYLASHPWPAPPALGKSVFWTLK
jgi:hypothetical protein